MTLPRQELDETMAAPQARFSSTAVAASGAAVARSLSESAAVAGVDGDGALRSSGVAVASDSNAGSIRTVSPTTIDRHADNNAEFLSAYLCPFLLNEPPVKGVYFDVAGADGEISQQVFEYSRLYRYIATPGVGRSFRSVHHPLNRGAVSRLEALPLVRRVSPEQQELFNQERLRRGLTLVDDEPVGPNDTELFEQTMCRMRDA
jgi:hypothetical protein